MCWNVTNILLRKNINFITCTGDLLNKFIYFKIRYWKNVFYQRMLCFVLFSTFPVIFDIILWNWNFISLIVIFFFMLVFSGRFNVSWHFIKCICKASLTYLEIQTSKMIWKDKAMSRGCEEYRGLRGKLIIYIQYQDVFIYM